MTSTLRTWRAPSCANAPKSISYYTTLPEKCNENFDKIKNLTAEAGVGLVAIPSEFRNRPEAFAGMVGERHLPGNTVILYTALELLILLEAWAAALIAG